MKKVSNFFELQNDTNTDMENTKNTNNSSVNQESENGGSIYDIELDKNLSQEVAETIESLKNSDSSTVESSSEKPLKKKRGRPRKNSMSNEKSVKNGSKKIENTVESKSVSVTDEEEDVVVARTAKKREKKSSNSAFNLFLFALIFAALVGAQFVLRMEKKDDEAVNVSKMEITAEEEIAVNENTEESQDTEVAAPVENKDVKAADEENKEAEMAVVQIEEKVSEEDQKPEVVKETVVIKEEVTANHYAEQTKSDSSSTMQRSYGYYSPDPYTNGSQFDLDGPQARITYLRQYKGEKKQAARTSAPRETEYVSTKSSMRVYDADGNYVGKITKDEVYKSEVNKTDLPQTCKPAERYTDTVDYNYRSYSDRRNPWNSGGVNDLDHPQNRMMKAVSTRSNDY